MEKQTKTPEEIKRGLALCKVDECFGEREDCPYAGAPALCVGKMCDDVLAYIQQLEQCVPRWISVEERLPEDGVNVLVYGLGNNENSTIAMTSYTHRMYGYDIEGWCSPWQYFFHEYKITHWMPIPEPPDNEKEESHE